MISDHMISLVDLVAGKARPTVPWLAWCEMRGYVVSMVRGELQSHKQKVGEMGGQRTEKLMPGEIYLEEQGPQYMSTQEQCRLWRGEGCQKLRTAPTSSLNLPSAQQLGLGTMGASLCYLHAHAHEQVCIYACGPFCAFGG